MKQVLVNPWASHLTSAQSLDVSKLKYVIRPH